MQHDQQSVLDMPELKEAEITSERATVSLADIGVDEAIYPRKEVDSKRASRYAALMRDGIEFPTIEIQEWPEGDRPYRVLDGAHRLKSYQELGLSEVEVVLVNLDGTEPLLYAASKANGPKELGEKEAEDVACRAYTGNPKLTSAAIGKAIGRSRSAVDGYIGHLRAKIEFELDLKIFRMERLGIPQDRIAERVGETRDVVQEHLCKMPELAISTNADLARKFTIPQVAEKHSWPEPLVWGLALDGKGDHERFEALKWGLRTWDNWYWGDCDQRFGDDWPGRIPAQLVAHALYYFTKQGDLVFDPMAGGGVVPDTCLAMNRRCWAFDLNDRPETRPEIETHHWLAGDLQWPVNGKSKPDLVFFDPPYYTKMAADYAGGSISDLGRSDYLQFFTDFFLLAKEHTKRSTRLAFLNADWRDFESTAAMDEDPTKAITIIDYARLMESAGWQITHIIDAPLSSERFSGNVVKHMQANRTLGIVRRTLLMARRVD